MSIIPIKSLIDPTASVIDRSSSTRSIELIHRCLLSHLVVLEKVMKPRQKLNLSERAFFDIEYNSTAQLAEDIGTFLKGREDA